MMKNVRMSRKVHTTKRWRPPIDKISPPDLTTTGDSSGNMTGDEGLAPKKSTSFTGYAENTKPPKGRALPVRGEHED